MVHLFSLLLAAGIAHQRVPCVPVDRYARVAAEAPSAAGVALEFRTTESGSWYAARMAREGSTWTAFLPRPTRAGQRLEYRLKATETDATTASTDPAVVRVVATAAECEAESSASVGTPIVVTVPEGAPLVPPVPVGLSPAGVVAAQEKPRSNTALKIAGGAAIVAIGAAVAAGTAASSSDEPDEELFTVPGFSFDRTVPTPGSTISVTQGDLQVFVRMAFEPALPITIVWQVELASSLGVCARMGGVFPGAQRPVGLIFSNPITVTGTCGTTFEVSALRVAIDYQTETVYDQTVSVPFRFTP